MKRNFLLVTLLALSFAFSSMVSAEQTPEERISVLESENMELKKQIETLESEKTELEELVKSIQSAPETEEQISTEVIGSEYTDEMTVRLVQQALNEAGFDCGNPDGKAGQKTHNAISEFQKQKKINVNGIITDELLEALGIAEKVSDAAKAQALKNDYSWDYTYTQLARNPESYKGDKVAFKGIVIEAQTGDGFNYIRLAANSDFNTILLITYESDLLDYKILEDDRVTVYGTCNGDFSYVSVMGATITVPWIMGDIIELQ